MIFFPLNQITDFLGAICPSGNYVGAKSSERHFSSWAISREIFMGGNYLWGNCPGAIIQEQSSRGQLSGRQFSSGAIVGEGGNNPGGSFPRRQLSGHPVCFYTEDYFNKNFCFFYLLSLQILHCSLYKTPVTYSYLQSVK